MNKLTKVGLTALAGSLVAGSVSYAGEMSASGSASLNFTGGDEKSSTQVTVGQWVTQLHFLLQEM